MEVYLGLTNMVLMHFRAKYPHITIACPYPMMLPHERLEQKEQSQFPTRKQTETYYTHYIHGKTFKSCIVTTHGLAAVSFSSSVEETQRIGLDSILYLCL